MSFAYEGRIEQARCDIVEEYSSAPSPRDLPPLQLKVNLPLLQVELDQMHTEERGQHGEELFVYKDTLSPLFFALAALGIAHSYRAMSPVRGPLASVMMSSTASGLPTRSPGHQPWPQCPSLSECPEPKKGHILRSPEQC